MATFKVFGVLTLIGVCASYKITTEQPESQVYQNSLFGGKSPVIISAQCRAMCIFQLSLESKTHPVKTTEALKDDNVVERFQILMPKILRSRRSTKESQRSQSDISRCWDNCQTSDHGSVKLSDELMKTAEQDSVLEISTGKVTWPKYKTENVVYVVVQKYGSRKAKEIIQTANLEATIPSEISSSSILVLVVGVDGLKCIYNEKLSTTKNTTPIENVDSERVTIIPPSYELSYIAPFELHITSLLHHGSLVITEVSWPVVTDKVGQEYHVSWELTNGGLKGTLITESTSVTLSLLPDTSYQITVSIDQVNLDSEGEQPSTSSSIQSYPLIVDTSIASFSSDQHPSFLTSDADADEHSYEDASTDEDYEEGEFYNYKLIGKVLGVSFLSAVTLMLLFILVVYFWIKLRESCSRRYFDGCTSNPSLLESQENFETIYNPTVAVLSKTVSSSIGDFHSPFISQIPKSLCMNSRADPVSVVDCCQQFQ